MSSSGLARYLIREGVLSEIECRKIAHDHSNKGAAFAKVIVGLGIFSEESLARYLVEKTRLGFVELNEPCVVDPNAKESLSVFLLKNLEGVASNKVN